MIAVEDLAVRLGGTDILEDVSMTVSDGELVGLIGPNGAGKTTLLRTINGAISPRQGRVRVDDQVVDSLSSRAVSRLVATVPQTTQLSFDFSVREAVEMGRTPHRSRFSSWRPDDTAVVDRAMERTGVAAFADSPVTELSGGERQRVLIARALAQETPVVLLDEPTASLDITHQIRTLELVRDLVAEGKTAVAAIHDLNLAAHYCDRLVLLAESTVLAVGTPNAVLTEERLREAFGANTVVSTHPLTGSVYVTAFPESRGTAAGRLHVVGGGGTAARVMYLLSSAGYTLTAGALNQGDTDTETARALGVDVVTVPPYAAVDDEALATVRDHVAAADAVVVTDIEVSGGNLPNLEAATAADEVVLVEQRPFSERNFAGSAGQETYDRLRRQGTVTTPDGLLRAVEAAVGSSTGQSPTTTTDHESLVTDDTDSASFPYTPSSSES